MCPSQWWDLLTFTFGWRGRFTSAAKVWACPPARERKDASEPADFGAQRDIFFYLLTHRHLFQFIGGQNQIQISCESCLSCPTGTKINFRDQVF
jgi:hypothetical protein